MCSCYTLQDVKWCILRIAGAYDITLLVTNQVGCTRGASRLEDKI